MRKTLLILGLVTLTCSGCFRVLVPVPTVWPAISYPKRPHIEIPEYTNSTDPKVMPFIKSTFQYSRHIDVLEKAIEAYNKEAAVHNRKIEQELFE